uniref:Uncharacterized AAA domain-containing protein ycf46 n=1 Tax=Plocamium cartilagineum TaxID=31452 RepID=A0A1C9CHY0_PLOCA|nr:hypothetical protein Plocam_131 [Plocamium cartilagineum]AOM67967.1 hypothetical protein Plocam_131 [Plocamium cartilagineum]
MHFNKELRLLLSSQHFLIYICTNEEERLEYTINQITQKYTKHTIYSWDFIDGYQNNPNYINKAKRNPLEALELIDTLQSTQLNIFILKDFHVFINDISITRKLKNIYKKLKEMNSYIVISAPEIKIPTLLEEVITLISFPLPNSKEIENELSNLFEIMNIDPQIYLENLVIAYRGFSIDKIRKSISKLIYSNISLKNTLDIILEEKQKIIQQTDILDLEKVNHYLEEIGGLTNLKEWLIKRSCSFSIQARNYGLPSPKGLLLIGIQGTGKSLSAKAIAQQWKIPLLKLDIGKIFKGIIGESEERIRQMINLAEKTAPCVLWIDEIDKIFNRMENNNDSGTTNRVLSCFLTWLSEKETQVFIVATANNIEYLPPELLRKGRFDEIFFLDLPNFNERCQIFQIHLMKIRPLTWTQYNIIKLSNLTEKFSGAEIKQSIVEAMHNAFYEKREFNTEDIIKVIREFIPLAFTNQKSISSLQEWAKLGNIRLASKSY